MRFLYLWDIGCGKRSENMFLKGEGLFRLDGAGGQIVGKGDAKAGERLSVDVQARIGDDLISHVAGLRFALEHLRRHQAGLTTQRDVIQTLRCDAAEFHLLDFRAENRLARGVGLI